MLCLYETNVYLIHAWTNKAILILFYLIHTGKP